MKTRVLNIGLALGLVAIMSACSSDDVIDAIADVVGADVSSEVYTISAATAYLDGNFVAIVKYVSEQKVDKVAIAAKEEYDIDNIIRVGESYGCSTLGLTRDSFTEYDGGTLTEYSGGGKVCYEFDYSTADSSNKGTAHIAYSTNNTLDF